MTAGQSAAGFADDDYGQLLADFRSGQEQLREAEVRFQMLVETIPGVAYIAEPGEHGAWIYISPRLSEVLGYDPQSWIDAPLLWVGLMHPDDRNRTLEDEARWTETTGGVHVADYRLLDSTGRYRWIRDAATARPGGSPGDKALWFGVLSDVTESRDAQEALEQSEALLRSVLETAQDSFVAIDGDGRVLEWNNTAESMFGRLRDDVLGGLLTDLVIPARDRASDPLAAVVARAGQAPRLGATVELTALREDGSEFLIELTMWSTNSGRSQRYNAFIRDITERRHQQDQLHALAFTDALTGLPNRASFSERLDRALAARTKASDPLAVLFLDIDDFKSINDNLGHAAGDRLLRVLSDRLNACVRPGDTVARFAGDEFALLLPDVPDSAHALGVADRVADALRRPLLLEGRTTVVSASIGLALSSTTRPLGAEALLREADAAMYHAKRSGKDACVVFEAEMHATALARLELQADLVRATETSSFHLNYQPYFRLADGRLSGFEALIRWTDPVRGVVSPVEFIPVAEGCGLIHAIGTWVLRTACEQAVGWRGDRPLADAPVINVNVSALQIQEPGFVETVSATLTETGLDPRQLVLEITEGVLLRRADEILVTLQRVRALGVRIAIDDFGTGYSSLSYLQHLPVDILKIDKAFVDYLGVDRDESSVAKLIVQIGRTLQLDVVAEGVEREEQVQSLIALGCGAAQGFHLGRPLSEPAAENLVLASHERTGH